MTRTHLVISVRQPWAWAIVYAGKDVENRTWPTRYRGPVFIHAGVAFDGRKDDALDDAADWARRAGIEAPTLDQLQRGGIIGIADIVGCVTSMDSRWFCGPYGFVLRNARPLPFVPCKGQLGFFPAPAAALANAEPQG
jgi:hypothetical protein